MLAMTRSKGKVLVAMSGGVDSSVAAALLQDDGYEVVGCFMRLGSPGESLAEGLEIPNEPAEAADHGPDEVCGTPTSGGGTSGGATSGGGVRIGKQGCCSINDARDAQHVAAKLGIPFYVLSFKKDFGRIIHYFVDEYNAGRTPNPCVQCNNWLKFGKLAAYARSLDADHVASGHYARIETIDGEPALLRGVDEAKDQSYVLFGARRDELRRTLLPVVIAPQVFARRPVLRYRWLTFAVLVLVGIGLVITFSRASALAAAFGLGVIAVMRYRRYIPVLVGVGLLLLLLPQAQFYLDRFIQAFTAQDLATQMRIGEFTDSLRLIDRYPIFGVGFTGTPDIDIYTDVANMYLIMANQIGLVGVGIFLTTMTGVLVYGLIAWRKARHLPGLEAIHLGFHAALVTALVNAVADLYFFRLDFQPLITLFWLTVALCLASSRLVFESTVDKPESME